MAPTPKKFINDPKNAVSEFAEGLLLSHPNSLQKLSNHNVILSNPITHTTVNILSGGGSGHEPSHAGWISSTGGMLTGAILGGVFASPSVASILAAIRAVTKPDGSCKGCLLIVKNYTGDRLNFGMACEMANAEGRKTKMVVVADDVALERKSGLVGARGVAGTVLVHKAAGAAVAMGMSLEEVVTVAEMVAGRIGSLGVALESVTIPGAKEVNDRVGEGMMEVGLGIHGEAGLREQSLVSADEICKIMVDTIKDYGYGEDGEKKLEKGDEVAVLVNNLGGVSNFEMSILTRGIVKLLESDGVGCKAVRVYVGSFMTSFDMKGASLSILCLDKEGKIAELLDAPTSAPAWSKAEVWSPSSGARPSLTLLPEPSAPPTSSIIPTIPTTIDDISALSSKVITAACANLIHNEAQLTKWDLIVGDGDCGLTMARGANEVLSRLNNGQIDTANIVKLFLNLAEAVSASMGGTSGVLIELMFRKMSACLAQEKTTIGASDVKKAFTEGVNAIQFYGGARVGSRTMLDALVPACGVGTIAEMAHVAKKGADGTATIINAEAGRSSYLSEKSLEGTPDPGAKAVEFVLEAMAGAV